MAPSDNLNPRKGAGVRRREVITGAIAIASVPSHLHAQSDTRMLCRFAGESFTVTLKHSPTAGDLMSLLPLELSIEDYSNNEKIAYPPSKLTTEGARTFGNERPGDFCYYAPWGDIVFFYAGYHYSPGLVRLGRLDGPIEPLLVKGTFPLRLEALE